ncbi:cryptochrome/photolyase family protein [Roseococcus sp. DSY-14]|uniref:cryptochrome/photolyase family protein n=1 Tax=Roseococcus sp. DSY-14 TaxID=3369650 RepID=UPI00387A9B7B
MTTLRLVLGDQCSRTLSALEDLDPARDVVLMMEVREEGTYVPHHRQKIALILSAMRHFARALAARGVRVDYVRLDDPANTHSFGGEVARAVARHRPARLVLTQPGEWRVLEMARRWEEEHGIPVEVREDTRFLCPLPEFFRWAHGRKQLRMEFFYRDMRRRTGLLMEGDEPAGGEWNYDRENRKPLPKGAQPPTPPFFAPDAITREVMALVAREFGGAYGGLDSFRWPVTAQEARAALADFVAHRLPLFGDHQDAMAEGEPFLWHSLLSSSMNCGLLLPGEACAAAEAAWRAGQVPLNAAEGFIRQVLGWREYVRGLYWARMPAYRDMNALEARRPLPDFYWEGGSGMRCMDAAIGQTLEHGYAHHIQRLMVTGNYALLAGLDPAQVNEWYLAIYVDAYEWVELPNVSGMVLHADGGVMASKPYAASGAYINRMSDHCRHCRFDVKRSAGEGACPFNFLYWDFIARHAERFAANPRMAMPLATLGRMAPAKLAEMRAAAARHLESVSPPAPR